MKPEETDRLIGVISRTYPANTPIWDADLRGLGEWKNAEGKTLRSLWHASFTLTDLADAQQAWATWAAAAQPTPPTCADLHHLIAQKKKADAR